MNRPAPARHLSHHPGVADVAHYGPSDAPIALLIEVPHGATEPDDFWSLHRQLSGALPAELDHFFYVNTDVGAAELGEATAVQFLTRVPEAHVVVVRARLPRTFLDVNRVLEATPGPLGQGGITAGIPPFITEPSDLALLRGLYTAYRAVVDPLWAVLAGFGLTPHTYAPRTVGIERIEADIVERLHAAWHPDMVAAWPLRPEVDLITAAPDGQVLAPECVVARLSERLAAQGVSVAHNASYTLHPATLGAQRAREAPGRVLCLEVRRDLLVERWDPFVPMQVDPGKVAPFAEALASALM